MKKEVTKKGFTLVESLVAITIVALAVAGPLYAANRSIIASGQARDQLVASYLAQQSVEYVRALRDDYYLSAYRTNPRTASSVGWNNFIAACSGSTCVPSTISSFPLFTRTVLVESLSTSEARVTARTSWSSRGSTYTVTVYDSLTPWQ